MVLDVADALEKTRNVLSFTPVGQSLSALPSPSPSSFLSIHIHPRASVHKSSHLDYKSLTLSRLERDSARVTSLATRLDLAVNGFSKSDLRPLDKGSELGAEDLESPIVSGSNQGSGEYFSRVGIGTPASQVYMVLDTGSDVNWVQCAPCADCYQQSDPIFEPSLSSSYSPLNCEAQQCKYLDDSECRNDRTCVYEVSYGDGSYTVGDFVTETITLGSDSVNNVAIGCGHDNEGLFVGAGGLLGLGGGPLSFSSQLNASTFSYCLVDRDSDSVSTLEFDSALPPNAVTAPLLRNHQLDTFYYLGLTGISVGGQLLPIPESAFQIDESGNGGIIIDSGTAVTRLRTDTYNVLRDAFAKGTKNLPSAGNGKVLPLPAKNYMIPVDSIGTFCFAFAPTSSTLSIIGNVQQQGTRVGFDLANSRVGFVPNKC
ncbi:Protein ASPARTIC PROTEASE IN GUARD CELL 1 [Hibiscus syriacus]|uniref:Protein ASPARTIC PROTEASE IN GUARD CELL 1 n=1 Tax=Hibiscus syriacus TaxID=106335 RepID=A0A6A2WWZ4_HIBSY|nr:Protein ASPARTIC PROTEASE IN GUARD CELL 1 [Hibiscus syriacus]